MSNYYSAQIGVQKKKLEKQVGFYQMESIDNPNFLTVSVNPKEYFEKYGDRTSHKKYK